MPSERPLSARSIDDPRTRALALFDDFADMPHHRQSRALAQLRDEDPVLHDELVGLLVADALEHPLDAPPVELLAGAAPEGPADTPPEARVGTQLGAWRIERLLQAGGMGAVYEASRADGHYQQRVAVKCIRAELSSPALISAFLAERNHLAYLDHPHIAPLLDGGVEPDGHPWFAMRYIEGENIEHWCDARELPVRRRVDLLIQACDALAHAHGLRVVHQDIKPDNLMVTGQGHVYLVDFGLSAALDQARTANPQRIAISNGYAAPEVHRGAPPEFASDVYAMGVVMYRLLCGEWPVPPHPLHARIVRIAPPPARPMSLLLDAMPASVARLRGRRRASSLARELAGDLDAIALRCVAAAPDARYRNAAELRDDLQRWREHRPVAARQGGRTYRLRRFLRRHAVAGAMTGAVVASLALTSVVLLWQRHQGRSQALAAQQVGMLFERTLGTATLSGLGDARLSSRELLAQTETELRALPLADEPLLKARALSMLARNYAMLGDYRHALALADEASRMDAGDEAQRLRTRTTLASLLNLQNRHAEAREAARAGLDDAEGRQAKEPWIAVQLRVELARAQWGLAEHDDALETLAAAQRALRSLPDGLRAAPEIELFTLRGHWEGERLLLDQAQADLQRAIALAGDGRPLLADTAREYLANVLAQKHRDREALSLARDVLARRRALLGDDHPETAHSARVLAELEARQGQVREARATLASVERPLLRAFGPLHPELAELRRVESLLDAQAAPGQGLAKARLAMVQLEQALGPLHEQTLRAKVDLARQLIAAPDAPQAEVTEAIALLQEAVQTQQQRRLPRPAWKLAWAQALRTRGRAGDRMLARRALQDALVESRRYLGADHPLTQDIRLALLAPDDAP